VFVEMIVSSSTSGSFTDRKANERGIGTDEEMSSGLMIQCDTCKCWQHGPCVGLWEEKVQTLSLSDQYSM